MSLQKFSRGLTRRPSRALDSPRALLPELQRNLDAVSCGALGPGVPQRGEEKANLNCASFENIRSILDCEKSTESIIE